MLNCKYLFYFLLLIFAVPNISQATENQSVLEQLYDDLELHLTGLLFYEWRNFDPNALRNPNNVLDLYDNKLEYQLRPDIRYQHESFRALIKPRLSIESTHWDDSILDRGTESEIDIYVNEWLIDYNFYDNLHLAGGRENLQWGPSLLLSSSNPFFGDNGLSNPKREIGGQDFVKLNWYPNYAWSLSLLANIGQGRYEPIWEHSDFEQTYALKIDYTSYRKFASFIGSYRNNDRARLGSYAGWNASDSLLLYGELGLAAGTDALYPESENNRIQYQAKNDDYGQITSLSTLGASYTFESGANLALEYLYNSAGYNDKEAELYFETFERLHCLLSFPHYQVVIQPDASTSNIKSALYPELRLLRKNYLFAQFRQLEFLDNLDLILRFTYNIDDQSANFVPILHYGLGDNIELFFIGLQTFGPEDAELSSFVDYNFTLGVQATF